MLQIKEANNNIKKTILDMQKHSRNGPTYNLRMGSF